MTIKGSRSAVRASASSQNSRFALGLLRACGGAILFSFPMLMTMEMWSLGFYMDPFRLALFIFLDIPLLVGLSYYTGFEQSDRGLEHVLDAFTAFTVGFAVSALMLSLFAIIGPGMSADEIIGKIAIQAVPTSIGAMLARSEFGESQDKKEKHRSARYSGGLFLMAVGALYLSSSLASTEEMVLIAYTMTPGHVIALMVFSLLVMHAFVYAVLAQGKSPVPSGTIQAWLVVTRFASAGYAIAMLISVGILWIYGRTDDSTAEQIIRATAVLGFPAAVGAGAARLILTRGGTDD